jgi:RNA polymerase sigma factor (TIGR02999 family)
MFSGAGLHRVNDPSPPPAELPEEALSERRIFQKSIVLFFMRLDKRLDFAPKRGVHEVYLKLAAQNPVEWQNKAHFFALAAQVMRRVLVDYARTRQREKRGGPRTRIALEAALNLSPPSDPELIALDEALNALAEKDPRKSLIVELRYFGGLSIEETAEALGVSSTTVRREWTMAKAWLRREMRSGQ